jgi:protein SCO1/2
MKRAFLALLAAAAMACAPSARATDAAHASRAVFAAQSPGALKFGIAPPAGLGGPIDLVDDHGHRFTSASLHGRPALLFFGFTHCGVTCPVALLTAKQLLHGASVMRTPAIVFVTLDPLSDDVATLHRFLDAFDTRLIGLTGTPTQVVQVAESFGVGMQRNDGRIEHSSVWYLLDGLGRVRRIYSYDTPANQMAADFDRLGQAAPGDLP